MRIEGEYLTTDFLADTLCIERNSVNHYIRRMGIKTERDPHDRRRWLIPKEEYMRTIIKNREYEEDKRFGTATHQRE